MEISSSGSNLFLTVKSSNADCSRGFRHKIEDDISESTYSHVLQIYGFLPGVSINGQRINIHENILSNYEL